MPIENHDAHFLRAAEGYGDLGLWLDADAELEKIGWPVRKFYSRFSNLRRLFPDLLPRRLPTHRPLRKPRDPKPPVRTKKKYARAKLISDLRRTGAGSAEIAKKVGVSSNHALRAEVSKLRRLYPELLPRKSAGRPR